MRHLSLHRGGIVTDGAILLMARSTDQMWSQIVQRFGWRWVASLTDPWRDDPWRDRPGRRVRNP